MIRATRTDAGSSSSVRHRKLQWILMPVRLLAESPGSSRHLAPTAARHRFRHLGAAATSCLLLGALLGTTMTIAPAGASETSPVSPGATQLMLSTNVGTNPGVGTTTFPHAIGCSSGGNCTAVGGYVDSPGKHQVMVVTSLATPTTPTISNLPASGTYGGNFTAIVSTNGDGSTSVTSNSTSICTVSGFVVSYVGVGTCSLTAHVSAGTDYGAADGSAQTFTVGQGSQTISFTAPASGSAGGSATLSATGGASGNAVVFSVDPSSGAGVCNVSGTDGTTVNYTATGSCVIDVNQAGNAKLRGGH